MRLNVGGIPYTTEKSILHYLYKYSAKQVDWGCESASLPVPSYCFLPDVRRRRRRNSYAWITCGPVSTIILWLSSFVRRRLRSKLEASWPILNPTCFFFSTRANAVYITFQNGRRDVNAVEFLFVYKALFADTICQDYFDSVCSGCLRSWLLLWVFIRTLVGMNVLAIGSVLWLCILHCV